MSHIATESQQLPVPGSNPLRNGPNFNIGIVPNRESVNGSNRASFNMSDGQPYGTETNKLIRKGPAVYPAEYYYQVDRWAQLYQDTAVMISMKRNNAVLNKSKIYAKINIAVENLLGTSISQVSLKIKNSPASKSFIMVRPSYNVQRRPRQ